MTNLLQKIEITRMNDEFYVGLSNAMMLLILAVTGNFVAETLSCKTQYALTNNMYLKHLVILFGVSLINLKGKSFNTLEGSVNLSSLNLINSINEINFNPIFINQKISLNKREFLIENNDFIRAKIVGDFKNEEIIFGEGL